MILQDLAPENTKRALSTAINTFQTFLTSKNTNIEFIRAKLLADSCGAVFERLMDRFAMFLAFTSGKGGELRKRNTVMSYYRNVKNWLLEDFPRHRPVIEQKLLKMGRILERHCLKRQQGGLVNKAHACTKTDLRSLIDGLYYDATDEKEYQDAALLAIMWYAFGRASDLAFIQKCNLSVSSDNVLFMRLIRTKTSEEQGLSLYPDKSSFVSCPIHAIAMELAMQSFPISSVLSVKQLFENDDDVPTTMGNDIPLIENLLNCEDEADNIESSTLARQGPAPIKLQGYVNRILKTASSQQSKADITSNLSSHSFRRGGAQHANGDATLSAQWIFDRGNWNMTATNKAVAYVFNTTSEDTKVSNPYRTPAFRL